MDTVSTTLPSSFVARDKASSPRSHSVRTGFLCVCAVLAAWGFFTPNGLVTSVAFMVLPLAGILLYREGEAPVLLFGCVFQWLQATAAIFYTNNLGISLNDAFGSNALNMATWLSIATVLVLALGERCGFVGAGGSLMSQLASEASRMSIEKIAVLYGVSLVVATLLTAAAWHLPSIMQPLLAIAALKWGTVFLLCYTVLHQKRGYGWLLGCIGLEFAMGLMGSFANFKGVFFVLVVAAMSSPLALRGRRLVVSATCFILLFVLGVVWSAVKMDYRTFLSEEYMDTDGGIPIERKFGKLADLVESVTWENLNDGIDALILRVSYVNYFALAIENVPARVPFENGELWKGAVIHVLTPRFLFPDKPILDDSERTRLYTGMQVAGAEADTSIGIGYVGESYIDFGPVWMFAPIFCLGILYGVINRFFITRTRYKLIGSAFAVSILVFNAYELEVSNIKLVGGVIAAALVGLVIYNAFGGALMAYLQQSPLPTVRRQPKVGPTAA